MATRVARTRCFRFPPMTGVPPDAVGESPSIPRPAFVHAFSAILPLPTIPAITRPIR